MIQIAIVRYSPFSNRNSYMVPLLPTITATVAILVAVGMSYYYPREQVLDIGSNYVGVYRGFGWHEGRGITGKNWLLVRVDEGAQGRWEVDMAGCKAGLNGYGYARYRGYYLDGSLREEGICFAKEVVTRGEPAPRREMVLQGKYYDPNGHLASEVTNGTGRQILFYADGTMYWELELCNGRRVRHASYWPSGQIRNAHGYDSQERPDGPYTLNYEDGTPQTRGLYQHGKIIGSRCCFHPDGSVATIEDHSTVPPSKTQFLVGVKYLNKSEEDQLGF